MSKITFGQFLAKCRQGKRLTQKELADLLYVGESAVSKWENDKRQPGLELISRLSEIFGITESELIKASIDENMIKEKKQARKFRIINSTYNFVLILGFSIALLVCFIVNLAVSHTLSWFSIVLSAIMLAAIILLLPQYIKKYRLLIIPLSWLIGLYCLLGIICIYTQGDWYPITLIALLLAFSLIFTPIYIHTYLPKKYKENNALITVAIDALILQTLLVSIDAFTYTNHILPWGWSLSIGFPIVLYWVCIIVLGVLIIGYIKTHPLYKTALCLVVLFISQIVFTYGVLQLLNIETNTNGLYKVDLTNWNSGDQIESNVMFFIYIFFLLAVSAFAVSGYIHDRKKKNSTPLK